MLPDRALHVLIDLLLRHSRRVITGRWDKTGGNLHSPVSVALLGPRTKCEQMNGPGPWSHCINWGQSSSPALYQDRLILACYNPSSSFLLALDKRTGKQIWRTDREKGVISYSTPLIIETPQGPVVALNTSERVEAFDPINGKLKWQFSEANHFPIPMPVFDSGVFYLNRGYRSSPYMAIRAGGQGDISQTHEVWRVANGGSYVPSLVFYEGLRRLARVTQ
jgi:outer membrane protein assembly factor BamB